MHVKVYRKWFFKTIGDNQHVSDYGPFARADVKPQRIITNSSGGAASSIQHCRATAVHGSRSSFLIPFVPLLVLLNNKNTD